MMCWNTSQEAALSYGPFLVQLQVKRCYLPACHLNSNIEKVCQFSFMCFLPRWESPLLRLILMFLLKLSVLVNSLLVRELSKDGHPVTVWHCALQIYLLLLQDFKKQLMLKETLRLKINIIFPRYFKERRWIPIANVSIDVCDTRIISGLFCCITF